MKLLMAMIAYVVVGLVLGWGMLLAVKGEPWLLVVGLLTYAAAFAKLGCLAKKSH
jgi:F0F1-type ATP synthase assembly protein I